MEQNVNALIISEDGKKVERVTLKETKIRGKNRNL
jgi:hypothetical protein